MTAGEAAATPLAAVSTAAVNDARKFDFFCDAICDVYAGIQPVEPDDTIFDAEFRAISVGSGILASIAAPGHVADRGNRELRRRPDESLFLNLNEFSAYGARHAGRDWQLAAGRPFLLDNARPFHLEFDPSRRMQLYSLRFDRAQIGMASDPHALAAINQAIATDELGRHLELQMRLMCNAMRSGEIGLAGLMSRPVIALLTLIAESSPVKPPPTTGWNSQRSRRSPASISPSQVLASRIWRGCSTAPRARSSHALPPGARPSAAGCSTRAWT